MSATLERQTGHFPEELPPFPVRRWSLDEYHALIEQGMFEDERVELLEGWIVPKMTKNPPHEATIYGIAEKLRRVLPQEVSVRQQAAVTLSASEPEPDLSIVRGDARQYLDRHPSGADIYLVIEVSDSSLSRDRRKAEIYAKSAIPNYWIVDLNSNQIEAHSQPHHAEKHFEKSVLRKLGETLSLSIEGRDFEIRIDHEFLPAAGKS